MEPRPWSARWRVTYGRALDLVLRPGNGGGRTTLAIERLHPSRAYHVEGATTETITADATGRALVDIELDDRREVGIHPVT